MKGSQIAKAVTDIFNKLMSTKHSRVRIARVSSNRHIELSDLAILLMGLPKHAFLGCTDF